MKKKSFSILLLLIIMMGLVGCKGDKTTPSDEDNQKTESEVVTGGNTNPVTEDTTVSEVVDLSYRQDRDFSKFALPTNQTNEEELPDINSSAYEAVIKVEEDFIALKNGDYRLDFSPNSDGKFVLQLVHLSGIADNEIVEATSDKVMFINNQPAMVYVKGNKDAIKSGYDSVVETNYGVKAIANLTTKNGSVIEVMDCYYFPDELETGVFNVRQTVKIISANANDEGFASEYSFSDHKTGGLEWFVPNNVFKKFRVSTAIYRETTLGIPMIMMRNSTNGYTLSLSRYQPVVHYEDNSYATLEMDNANREIVVAYPSNEANRKYHTLETDAQHVYDLSIRAEVTTNYEQASSSVYNAHFNLQDQRIVNTDIDEVYKVILEDYKVFLHATEQEDEESGKKYTSYGLPWRITIEDGEFGPLTYQAGFIGQQLPAAYNMMLYSVMNNDLVSLQNGINVIDFWVDDAEFMSVAGVPHIWYDTWSDGFRSYPCFLRMAVDAMEGLLDAYRLASAHGIEKDSWYNALIMFGDFLVNNQNADGSYYRCYNYDGGPFVSWDNGIEEPPNNICQSESKGNTPMAVRFLGKLYEMTEDDSYYDAAINAGEYIYNNLYQLGYYQGGTCDNPNAVDKEAGVYAMYAYDTLYTLTGESKWLECLKQATAFTMSSVLVFSYPVKDSKLKSAMPLEAGYNDGMSFIVCSNGSGVDNYISYIYYELFRIYIYTGDSSYLKQAEFIQQNTKSIMNWDNALNYKYKSLVAEASTIHTFNYSSADDGAWVTWSSTANAEPIAKMYTTFGEADVMKLKNKTIEELRSILDNVGCGGKAHVSYDNTVIEKIE